MATRQRKLTSNDKKLASKIKELRIEKGLKQEELADKIGANHLYIVYVETGRRGLSLPMLYKIAKALSAPLKELFDF